MRGRDTRYAVVFADAPDVIHEIGTGSEGSLSDDRLCRIDAEGRLWQGPPNGLDHRHHSTDLVVGGNLDVPRSGRLAADVEQIGALGDHRPCLDDRSGDRIGRLAGIRRVVRRRQRIGEEAVTGERVRGHVDDTHDECPLSPREPAPADRDRRGRAEFLFGGSAHRAATVTGSRRSGSSTSRARTAPTR